MNRRHFLARALLTGGLMPFLDGCGRASPAEPDGQRGAPGLVYVAPGGSDSNAGTADAPWLTISHAVAQLRAGDTLLMRGGVYAGTANVIDSERFPVPSGTSWNNAVTIAALPGEPVILRPDGGLQAIRLTTSAPHFLVFQDFVIDMVNQMTPSMQGGPSAIYVSSGAHHNRFQRLDVGNNAGNGIEFSDNNGNSPFNEVLQCSIHDNGRHPAVNSGYGAYVFTSDNLFAGNTIYGNGGYGLHFFSEKGVSQVSRNMIRNNRIYGNGRHGGTNYGVVIASGDGNVARENAISGNRGGLLVYERSSNALVEDNTIVDNAPLEGILITGAVDTVLRGNRVSGNATDIVDMGSRTVWAGSAARPPRRREPN
ncbi:MAG TPA: right-handed parallel beta-helix repeat-containing protein [Vicinamibacterales bacterium]|nr:right-handed parallel beta-helix repeat-containing protein [Vicinamibacterales bacterium]